MTEPKSSGTVEWRAPEPPILTVEAFPVRVIAGTDMQKKDDRKPYVKSVPAPAHEHEWVKECKYIALTAGKGGRVREMNHDPNVFIRYCQIQAAQAARMGFPDSAAYIQRIIDGFTVS